MNFQTICTVKSSDYECSQAFVVWEKNFAFIYEGYFHWCGILG